MADGVRMARLATFGTAPSAGSPIRNRTHTAHPARNAAGRSRIRTHSGTGPRRALTDTLGNALYRDALTRNQGRITAPPARLAAGRAHTIIPPGPTITRRSISALATSVIT